jgi:tRNA threonylcarbamoyladenosine biosynthesis protein TsaE
MLALAMDWLAQSPDEMRTLGASLGGVVVAGDAIGLVGDLGAGKTVFVQGLAAGLGYPGAVTSPTFTLIHIYEGGRVTLYHADLYRLERSEELEDVGLDDIFRQDGVAVVEWADRFPAALPVDRLELRLEVVSAEQRRVTPSATGARSAALLGAWRSAVLGP